VAVGINMQLVLPLKLGGKANREFWFPNGNMLQNGHGFFICIKPK